MISAGGHDGDPGETVDVFLICFGLQTVSQKA